MFARPRGASVKESQDGKGGMRRGDAKALWWVPDAYIRGVMPNADAILAPQQRVIFVRMAGSFGCSALRTVR